MNNLLNFQIDIFLDSIYDGVYITDNRGVFLKVNKAVERITGIKRDDLIGTEAPALVKRGVINKSVTKMVIEQKKRISITQTIKGKYTKEVLVSANPIFNDNKEIDYIITNLRDLTELKSLERKSEKHYNLAKNYYSQLKKEKYLNNKIIAESEKMKDIVKMAFQASQIDSTVLITGESGVGKEIIAQFISDMDKQSENYLTINCAAIPNDLLESELFGYEKGAFTGAFKRKKGLFEIADGGTLFMDEIDSLALNLQAKLLRVIDTMKFSRIGSNEEKKVNVRLIVASNKNFDSLIEEGKFRHDLYYRINVIPIDIPPLRERKEDISALTMYFLHLFNNKFNKNIKIKNSCISYLENYDWPGNVRELRNLIERIVAMENNLKNNTISSDTLPQKIVGTNYFNKKYSILINEVVSLEELINDVEKILIKKALNKYGSTRKAAIKLKISQSSVVRKKQKYNIDY